MYQVSLQEDVVQTGVFQICHQVSAPHPDLHMILQQDPSPAFLLGPLRGTTQLLTLYRVVP